MWALRIRSLRVRSQMSVRLQNWAVMWRECVFVQGLCCACMSSIALGCDDLTVSNLQECEAHSWHHPLSSFLTLLLLPYIYIFRHADNTSDLFFLSHQLTEREKRDILSFSVWPLTLLSSYFRGFLWRIRNRYHFSLRVGSSFWQECINESIFLTFQIMCYLLVYL